jgi:hypothetical protein
VYILFIHLETRKFIYEKKRLPWTNSSEEFFNQVILQKSSGIWILDGISWQVLIALIFVKNHIKIKVWIIIFISVWKGIKSVSIVSLITVPLPFLFLFVLFIRFLILIFIF